MTAVSDGITDRDPAGRSDPRSTDDLSILAADLTVFGDLHCEGHLEIEGRVEGNVYSRTLTLGPSGHIVGSVVAESVHLRGTVHGPIRAVSVSVGAAAEVVGDIVHHHLAVDSGAVLVGRRPWRPLAQLDLSIAGHGRAGTTRGRSGERPAE